jgi:RHS repeat-associated protein
VFPGVRFWPSESGYRAVSAKVKGALPTASGGGMTRHSQTGTAEQLPVNAGELTSTAKRTGTVIRTGASTGRIRGSRTTCGVFFNGQRVARVDRPSGTVHYYFSDRLGSARVVTDANGNLQQQSDYFPYGGEIVINAGDPNHYKFTGKERDAESGLDNFGARYFGSSLGRFMSPDPLLNSGHPGNPQTWNRYSYALNNPLKIKDPTGLYNVNCGDDKSCQKSAERLKKGLEKLQNKVDKMKDSDQKTRLEHALGAMGTENDGNNVNVSFGAIVGTAAATTDAHFDSATNSYSSFDVKFDMSKTGNSDANGMAINGAHEGTHVGDYQDPLGRSQNPATAMDGFQYEFRGYQTSAWAAQALGVSPLSFGGNVIWNSSWAAADRQTLMGRGITGIVTGAPYNQPENPIHDPWPDRFPEPNPGPF